MQYSPAYKTPQRGSALSLVPIADNSPKKKHLETERGKKVNIVFKFQEKYIQEMSQHKRSLRKT